jgi:alcohol dehydrogenase
MITSAPAIGRILSPTGSGIAQLHLPPIVHFGRGALAALGPEARGFGDRALLVTDRGMAATGIVDQVVRALRDAGVEPLIFDRVEPNPTIAQVEAGLAAGAGQEIRVIVSVGGGSAHDCAKVIALVAANGGEVRDFEGLDRSAHRGLPLICVNTTAGSGADVSRYAVITDPARGLKMIIVDRHLMPRVAINDPLLTVGMPAAVTMASGLDALTHAIEAYVSTLASELSSLCALRAVELVLANLERAVRDGSDLEAREGMLMGSLLGGMAIDSASVGAVHAMAHQLGALYDLPHGVCNGILLPVVVEFNESAASARYGRIATVFAGGAAGRRLPALLRALGDRVGLPRGLAGLGVERSRIPELAARAMTDMCMATNPRPMTEADVVRLFERAL